MILCGIINLYEMRKIIYYVLILPAVVALMSSCGGNKADAKMLSGDWEIVSVNGEKVEVEDMPFLEFDMDTKKIHGNTGCNIFNSTFTLSDSDITSITIAPGMSTMMACPNLDLEGKISKALLEVATVQNTKTPESIALADKDGNVLLVLTEK